METENNSSIIMYRDYGDIVIDIKTIMEEKGLTISYLVRHTGLHHKVIKKYYEGLAERYDRQVLAKLCYVIECDLSDIMKYQRPQTK